MKMTISRSSYVDSFLGVLENARFFPYTRGIALRAYISNFGRTLIFWGRRAFVFKVYSTTKYIFIFQVMYRIIEHGKKIMETFI